MGIQVEFVARGRIALLSELVVTLRGAVVCTVPAGFISDGGTIPPFFWPMVGFPYAGSALRATIAHDFLCSTRTRSSTETHRLLYALLRDDGVAWARAQLIYHAVRWLGPHWNTP